MLNEQKHATEKEEISPNRIWGYYCCIKQSNRESMTDRVSEVHLEWKSFRMATRTGKHCLYSFPDSTPFCTFYSADRCRVQIPFRLLL